MPAVNFRCIYEGTSISEGKLRYIEMHIIYTDPNKMLFFHIVTVLCNALFTSFDKLLYSGRKKFLFVVEARNAPSPSRRRCEIFVLVVLP
jgi:hypothetical protein